MKINKNKNIVLILGVSLLLGLCGCRNKDEVVFVDAEQMTETQTSSNNMPEVVPETEMTSETVQEEAYEGEKQPTDQQETLIVHVCGAVASPGVYELSFGSRVIDAVNRAGGLLETASMTYVNLAAAISDGDKIMIPTREEVAIMQQNSTGDAAISVITSSNGQNLSGNGTQMESSDKININTADKALLCTLPGIGETRANSIITYREEHGKFSSIEDIMQISGIKDSSFQKIKDLIVVN